MSIHNHFLNLLDNLFNPNLDLLLLLDFGLFASAPPLIRDFGLAPGPPCIPLVDETLALSNEFSTLFVYICSIFLFECASILAEILPDKALLLFVEQRTWTRPPEELLEPIENVLLQLLTAEVPDGISVLKLKNGVINKTETVKT